jgi:DNA-binding response OmpR family regulator
MRRLQADGHNISLAEDGSEALMAIKAECPEIVILDLNLPRINGEAVLAELKQIHADLPVIVLTARRELDIRLRCFELGADDLILKPFSFLELLARCQGLVRRRSNSRLCLQAGDLRMNRVDRSVTCGEQRLSLTNREYTLLEALLLNRGHSVSRAELLETVWKLEPAQSTNIVDVYINYLRQKLGKASAAIRTVRGAGYMIPLTFEPRSEPAVCPS